MVAGAISGSPHDDRSGDLGRGYYGRQDPLGGDQPRGVERRGATDGKALYSPSEPLVLGFGRQAGRALGYARRSYRHVAVGTSSTSGPTKHLEGSMNYREKVTVGALCGSSVKGPPGRIDSVQPLACFRPRDRLCHYIAFCDLALNDPADHDAYVSVLFFAERAAGGDPVPLFDLAVDGAIDTVCVSAEPLDRVLDHLGACYRLRPELRAVEDVVRSEDLVDYIGV